MNRFRGFEVLGLIALIFAACATTSGQPTASSATGSLLNRGQYFGIYFGDARLWLIVKEATETEAKGTLFIDTQWVSGQRFGLNEEIPFTASQEGDQVVVKGKRCGRSRSVPTGVAASPVQSAARGGRPTSPNSLEYASRTPHKARKTED